VGQADVTQLFWPLRAQRTPLFRFASHLDPGG
jgi:hypothetical protein